MITEDFRVSLVRLGAKKIHPNYDYIIYNWSLYQRIKSAKKKVDKLFAYLDFELITKLLLKLQLFLQLSQIKLDWFTYKK